MSSADVTIVIDRLVRRHRFVRALEYLVRSGVAASAVLCLGLLWDKFQPLAIAGWEGLFIAAGLVVLAGTAAGIARPISRLAAARAADSRLGLDDRLSSACEFLGLASPTPMMLAHVAETARHLGRVRPEVAAPFRVPRALPLLGFALVAMGFLVIVPGFAGRAPTAAKPTPEPLPALRFAGERTVDSMLAKLDARKDPRLADLMNELKKLYADLRAGEIPRDDALARVGRVESKLAEAEPSRAEGRTAHTWRKDVEKALAEKGAILAKDPATAEIGRAMAVGDLDAASKESRSLAGKADATPPTLKLTPEQSRALADLMAKAAEKGAREADELSKDMDAASQALTLEDMKKFADSLEKMAREMEQLKDQMAKLQGLARVGEEIEELKEALNALERDASGRWTLRQGGGERGLAGYFELSGVKPPEKSGEPEPGVGSTPEGPGTGGEPSRTPGTLTPQDLPGRWGEGPGLIEIVRGAASEGVATAAYKDAADAAAKIAEDAVHAEDIPLGYRFYIKRYFQTIRPPAENRSDK